MTMRELWIFFHNTYPVGANFSLEEKELQWPHDIRSVNYPENHVWHSECFRKFSNKLSRGALEIHAEDDSKIGLFPLLRRWTGEV